MTASALKAVIPGWDLADDPALERLDTELLTRAYQFGRHAHEGQKRSSGDDYVSHCVAVAKILAELHLDSITVASGLIHDVVEDTSVTVDDIEREFGVEMAQIVDGVTKIGNISFRSTQERQVENYRKLLLSIAKDVRVILIKLADRLHNMRTLDFLPEEKRRRIAQETMDLYAPMAHRFGMARVRWELEDLSFKHLEPIEYKKLAKLVAQKRGEREALIGQFAEPLERELTRAGIASVDVLGRPKHLWSIYKKMKQREKPYEEIYDLMAVRVQVDSVPDCYHALGIIHEAWTPLQERIKDYIAQPKSNGYQSLHTTVFGPGRQLYEVQIRTREMHQTAEYGIAAHWVYKESADGPRRADKFDERMAWFRQILEAQLDAKTPDEFLELLKLDLYQDEIFVFTPTGDVIQLPKNATPIDFAFAVHTEVGTHCQGARVNGRIAPLSKQLRNSDTVEILTAPSARPSRDWLSHVRTGRARHKIRQWIKQEEQNTSAKVGREMLDREVRRRHLHAPRRRGTRPRRQITRPNGRQAFDCVVRTGRRARAAGAQGDLPRRRVAARWRQPVQIQRVRTPRRSDARRIQGRAHPGRGRPHGALLAVLPARARRSGSRLRDARSRREHSSHRLPERAAPVARARATTGHRLAGNGWRTLPCSPGTRSLRSPRSLCRCGRSGDQ